jgi:hypothetical protein
MKKEEIVEKNKLIAEFIGWSDLREFMVKRRPTQKHLLQLETHDELYQFHSSWDWLIPVWTKIMVWGKKNHGVMWEQEITDLTVNIKTSRKNIISMRPILSRETPTIIDVYLTVVEFINWYNNLKEDQK